MEEQSYYDYLCSKDIIQICHEQLESGRWYIDENGLINVDTLLFPTHSPWVHIKHEDKLDCTLWHRIIFDVVCPKIGYKFVPSGCMDCYKVVVRPKTVKQLFALHDLEERMDRPSKCGIEIRPSVHGLYGGYFYNIGLENGGECYHAVREEVNKDKYLGEDVEVFLKRACTEYEHALGDSDKWVITDEQIFIEKFVNEKFAKFESNKPQPKEIKNNIKRRWIEWAYANADQTYSEFTNGKPLYPKYVTYHNSIG